MLVNLARFERATVPLGGRAAHMRQGIRPHPCQRRAKSAISGAHNCARQQRTSFAISKVGELMDQSVNLQGFLDVIGRGSRISATRAIPIVLLVTGTTIVRAGGYALFHLPTCCCGDPAAPLVFSPLR